MRLEYFQLIDQVAILDPAARVLRADCVVPETSPVFEGHFPGHPILPGVLMIETMAQAGGWLLLALLGFEKMCFLAAVKEAKMRTFLAPGAHVTAEARLLHDGSGYAVVAGTLSTEGRGIADAEITYRVLPFPNEALRRGLLETAARIGLPAGVMPHD
jgi:3-hydroxyacyl-[acyl-carrier-protein] dehydratase